MPAPAKPSQGFVQDCLTIGRAQVQLEAVRVGRGVKAAALALVLLGALAGCGWPDRAAAALLALLLVRCHLSVSEVHAGSPDVEESLRLRTCTCSMHHEAGNLAHGCRCSRSCPMAHEHRVLQTSFATLVLVFRSLAVIIGTEWV
jgi:hypothetical protein